MLESVVGVRVAVTLQKGKGADTVIVAAVAALLLAVVVNGAVMSVADVTLPSSSGTPVRLLHAVAAIGLRAVSPIAVDRAEQKKTGIANIRNCFMISSRCAVSAGVSRQRRRSL
jgi:hypothetical protein